MVYGGEDKFNLECSIIEVPVRQITCCQTVQCAYGLWSSETRWIRTEVRKVSVTLGGEYC